MRPATRSLPHSADILILTSRIKQTTAPTAWNTTCRKYLCTIFDIAFHSAPFLGSILYDGAFLPDDWLPNRKSQKDAQTPHCNGNAQTPHCNCNAQVARQTYKPPTSCRLEMPSKATLWPNTSTVESISHNGSELQPTSCPHRTQRHFLAFRRPLFSRDHCGHCRAKRMEVNDVDHDSKISVMCY